MRVSAAVPFMLFSMVYGQSIPPSTPCPGLYPSITVANYSILGRTVSPSPHNNKKSPFYHASNETGLIKRRMSLPCMAARSPPNLSLALSLAPNPSHSIHHAPYHKPSLLRPSSARPHSHGPSSRIVSGGPTLDGIIKASSLPPSQPFGQMQSHALPHIYPVPREIGRSL